MNIVRNKGLILALKEISEERANKISVHEAKRKTLQENVPEVLELDKEINRLGYTSLRYAMMDDSKAYDDTKKRIAKLVEKRAELTKAKDIGFDYSSPKWDCSLCEDTGLVDGRICSCVEQRVARNIKCKGGLYTLLESQSFDKYDISLYSDFGSKDESPRYNAKLNYDFARKYCENFASKYKNIYISGKTGAGKTFLSSCIAGELLKKGYHVIYTTAYNMIESYANIKFDKEVASEDNDYINCDLLIIDDLGSENMSEFNNSMLFQIINDRINAKKPMVISSNLGLEGLNKQYGGRITSRIKSSDFVKLRFTGKDLR